MSNKLSRRSLLKMAAGLVAGGAITWLPDQIKAGSTQDLLDTPLIPYHLEDRTPEQWELLRATNIYAEQPFAPYFLVGSSERVGSGTATPSKLLNIVGEAE